MSWTSEEARRVGDATELSLASRRPDGSLRPYTIMWVARVGDEVFVRSAGGPDRPWYRNALAAGTGRIRAGGVEADVTFESVEADADAIDRVYHAKYDRYGPGPVGAVTGPAARSVTVRLVRP